MIMILLFLFSSLTYSWKMYLRKSFLLKVKKEKMKKPKTVFGQEMFFIQETDW